MHEATTDRQKSFVHLHLHSQYSLLDGAIKVKDLVKKAVEYEMPAVAVTDHGNMFGAMDFYTKAKAAGIKPIIGSEIYFTPGSRFDRISARRNSKVLDSQDAEEGRYQIHHLVLLCKDNVGYRNLCKLLSKAYLEGFYYKPRADLELLREHREGLIATTACLKGEVGYNFFTGQDDRAIQAISKLKDIFEDDLYIEIQENGLKEQRIVNEKVVPYCRENGLKMVATCDSHYLTADDAKAQEVLLCIQTGNTFHDEKRMKLTTNEFYFKSAEEMRKAFSYAPEACDNTLEIADKCNVEFNFTDEDGNQIYHLPDYEIDTNESLDQYFKRMAKEGLEERFKGPHFKKIREKENFEPDLKQKYYERLEDELSMISRMGFSGYFLIVSDFIKWSLENGIPVGPGRGSGAGSLVAYSLKITNINPLPYNLLFERFINPERISMPDFDIDFCQDRRGEVIDYVTRKYGSERVGQIITFGKLQAKAVIRDVSRVFGLPYSEADFLAKLIPDELGITLEKAMDTEPKLTQLYDSDQNVKQVIDISKRLEGLFRHASIHAAGLIITNEPLVHYCPLYKGREGEQVVQFDKDWSEYIGLVKFDFLGLKTLTVINNASKFVKRDSDPDFDIEYIDLEDPNVYKLITSGRTAGVFQLESSGMQELCKRIGPDNIEDITSINALYRPGPLGSGMVDDFIERKHGRQEIVYPFKELKGILKETYGTIVYQEQVMNIARIVAGYSLGQADMLRRAMGKKKISEMDRHREIFREGAVKGGFDEKRALELYEQMAKFAEYGFNKSHAVAYAYIAYQTAFLKHYYPGAFFAALLSSEMSNTDKVRIYIQDAKTWGLEILSPDINESLWAFNVIGKKIRFGMGAVKNVGEGAVEQIIAEREERGPYEGVLDFAKRVNYKKVNKRVFESLIRVGAFDHCEKNYNRKTMLENIESLVSFGLKHQKEIMLGQSSLFSMGDEDDQFSRIDLEHAEELSDKDKLNSEAELMGIYVSGHPLDNHQSIIDQMTSMPIGKIKDIEGNDKRDLVLGGLLHISKKFINKKGNKMAFGHLEDLTGKIECIIFPKTFEKYEEMLDGNDPIIMAGKCQLSEDPRKFFPEKIKTLGEETDDKISLVKINLPLDKGRAIRLEEVKQLILGHRGRVSVDVIAQVEEGTLRMSLGEEFTVTPTSQFAAKINQILGANSVQFISG